MGTLEKLQEVVKQINLLESGTLSLSFDDGSMKIKRKVNITSTPADSTVGLNALTKYLEYLNAMKEPALVSTHKAVEQELIEASGDTITKTGITGWNYARTFSEELILSTGYVEFNAPNGTDVMNIGLALDIDNIDFEFRFTLDGNVEVFEDGTSILDADSYVATDVFKIARDSSEVTFYKNGIVLVTATIITGDLHFSTSLYNTDATVQNIKVRNI